MSLSITFRPQKDLYSVTNPTIYDYAYYNSRWVSGHLPVQYKILNTKFPENTDDDVDNICTVTDVNGFAEINLCGTYETYVALEYIKIEGSSVDSYNGVWKILEVVNATTLIISAAYDGAATATVQRYYNNYFNSVKVYAGIPQYHQFESEDPMSLIATLSIEPNVSNISIADISGLVKAKLNCDNDLDQISGANDLNAWTGFYIEYAESYEVSDGSEVTQYTSSYTTDDNPGCTDSQLIINGNFPSNINNWSNGSNGATWVFDSGQASATKGGAQKKSKIFYQEVELLAGVQYRITCTVTNNQANGMQLFIRLYDDITLASGVGAVYSISGTEVVNLDIIPERDKSIIGFYVQYSGSTGQKASLDNISCTGSDCTYYGFAINGIRQFQNLLGGNFGDYVQNFNEEVVLNKFLTHFDSPIWFNGLYFDISTIIPDSTFSATEEDSLFYYVKEYTEGGGFIQRQDIEITSKDDGVYRLPISDLTLDSETENFDIQIYQLPQNRFEDGNNGNFDYTVDPAATPPSDWGITQGSFTGSLYESTAYFRSSPYSMFTSTENWSEGYVIWTSTTPIDVQQNSDYVIEGYINIGTQEESVFFGVELSIVPVGIVPSYTEKMVIPSQAGDESWVYTKTVFNTGANSTVTIKAIAENVTPTETILDVFFDDITVKGPVENLSVIKNITVDNSCTKQNIYLTWLNNLGAWEYYNFKAEKDYSNDSSGTAIQRDVLINWDTDFISGETQDDFINVQSIDRVMVRSQFMTLAELNAVAQIKYAIRCQHIKEDGSKVTVLVDKGSFKKYSDGDKLFGIEFEISYPRIQIQTQ
jgi:hypothetical protein